jgi:hypothetical protein
MIRVFADARQALKGVLEMLAGRTDFHARFDVTPAGLRRSFAAAVFALPLWVFTVLVLNAIAAGGAGEFDAPAEPYALAYVAVRWAAIWAHFPVVAAIVTAILGRRDGFAPWVVVHNWTHLLVVLVQAVPMAMLVVGAAEIGVLLLRASIFLMVYAYVCAARAGLNVGWRMAIPAGCIALGAQLLVEAGLQQLM